MQRRESPSSAQGCVRAYDDGVPLEFLDSCSRTLGSIAGLLQLFFMQLVMVAASVEISSSC